MSAGMDGSRVGCATDGELVAFLDGALGSEAERSLAGHLEQCPRCRERLEALRERSERVRAWIREQDPPVPPADRLRPVSEPASHGSGAASPRRWSLGRWAAAAVLVLFAGAVGVPVAGWLAERVQELRSGGDSVPTRPDGAVRPELTTEFTVDGAELALSLGDANHAARLTVVRGAGSRASLTVPDSGVSLTVGPARVEIAGAEVDYGAYRLELPPGVERLRIQSPGRPDEFVRGLPAVGDSIVLRVGPAAGAREP